MNVVTREGRLDRETAEALEAGRPLDAFALLGPHEAKSGRIVRVFVPGAQGVEVIGRDDGKSLGVLTAGAGAGLFEGPVERSGAYVLRIQWPDAVQETEDAYAFGPALGDLDLHLFNEGRHFELAEALGANVMSMEGVEGVRFAVWAPNAERVAVIGDFNSWDRRRHPMRLRPSAGVWEIFVPRLGPGTRYKFDIVGPGGVRLPDKADPVAQQAELAPGTASVVAAPAAGLCWNDEAWMAGRAGRQSAAAAISIYEVHAGSWMRQKTSTGAAARPLWDFLAERLVPSPMSSCCR